MTNTYTQTYQNIYDILVESIRNFEENQPFDESALTACTFDTLNSIGEQDCIVEELMCKLMNEMTSFGDDGDQTEQEWNEVTLYWLKEMRDIVEPYELPGDIS